MNRKNQLQRNILPITIDSLITSECWTFYKFAVMQTTATYKDWLMDFMKVWTDEKGISFFGSPKERTQQSYYSDVLEIKDGHLLSRSPETIIDYIIDNIDSGYYVLLDVNYRRLYGDEQSFYLHEVLLHGYDRQKEIFYAPTLTSGFVEDVIPFEDLKCAFADVLKYYHEDHNNIFWRRYWTYGIMLLKPKEYHPDTDRYFEFIREIRDEISGCVYQKNEGAVNHKWVTGLPAFSLLAELFHKAYEDTKENKENIFNLSRSCLKLYEHQTILLESMQNFTEHLSAENELSGVISKYKNCVEKMHRIYLLCIKHSFTGDRQLLLRISEQLQKLESDEKEFLTEFDDQAAQIYIQKCLMPEPLNIESN